MKARRLTITATADLDGVYVDTVLRKRLELSGTVIRRIKWLEDGILVDGVRVTTRHRLRAGEVLDVRLSEPERRSDILPVPGPLDIVWEDDDLLILNKAPGVTVHPGPGHFDDTIGNFLLNYYEKRGWEGDFHPVHRLDRGTSGLLVVARHPHAQEHLKRQLHTSTFRRIYLAVCVGAPNPSCGTIDAPIASQPGTLARRVEAGGQSAVTHYETIGGGKGNSLLRLVLESGRTHQIRVHMAHIGHPLVGDFLYGSEVPGLIARPALHSAALELRHPITKEQLNFTLPLPQDMARLVEIKGG